MKIGILYDDVDRFGIDCSRPDQGNPGVGGTQYCFLMLIYYLGKMYPDLDIRVYRYCNLECDAKLPEHKNIVYIPCESRIDAIQKAKKDQVCAFVFSNGHAIELAPFLKKNEVIGVSWVHNWMRGELLETVTSCDMIKRVVFLGAEHYDRYIDHDVIKKAVILPNMFCTESYDVRKDESTYVVTYTGALIPSKGFGALAKVWKDIVKEVPQAELYVLGKGSLYGTQTQMGSYGLAERNFENQFIKDLSDENNNILPSVHFMGIMGKEKKEIYDKTKVGVINPTAVTEVCPISALEMEAAGIPVVSKIKNGLPDVVINGETGILIKKEKYLAKAIVSLLLDKQKNILYGNAARKDIQNRFDPENIVRDWYTMFEDIIAEHPAKYVRPIGHYRNNYKWIRIIIRKVRKVFNKMPALIQIEDVVSGKLRGH